jgi:hypothetical protein
VPKKNKVKQRVEAIKSSTYCSSIYFDIYNVNVYPSTFPHALSGGLYTVGNKFR